MTDRATQDKFAVLQRMYKKKLSEMNTSVASERSRVDDAEIKRLNAELSVHKSEIQMLAAERKQAKEDVNKLSKQLEELNAKYDEDKQNYIKMTEEYESVRGDLEEWREEREKKHGTLEEIEFSLPIIYEKIVAMQEFTEALQLDDRQRTDFNFIRGAIDHHLTDLEKVIGQIIPRCTRKEWGDRNERK